MRKFSKRVLAATLSTAMVFSLAACNKADNSATTASGAESSSASGTETTKGNEETTTAAPAADGATYTYNYALEVFPTNWNVHTYQTNTDTDILNYITEGLYEFDYNETMDGYKMVPGAAAAEPVDVTADYVGQFGIEDGDAAKAWKITLRDDLCWEDGTPITAKDYVTSAELLLNPVAKNYRADSLYSGNMVIAGAKAYLYQGQHAYDTQIGTSYFDMDTAETDENGVYTVDGHDVAFSLDDSAAWGSNSLTDYYGSDATIFQDADGNDMYAELSALADENGFIKVDADVAGKLALIIAHLKDFADYDSYAADAGDYAKQEWQEFCYFGTSYPETDFSTVGVIAESDTDLVLVLEKELSGFYLLYSLADPWLVNADLYKSCESVVDGVYQNSYCTSADTTISYGPYKLASYQADKQFVLERNDLQHDVKDGFYQTTAIQCDCVPEAATRLEMFLNGELDNYGLTADDMETYQSSDYTYYTSQPSTFYIALNPAMDALEKEQANLGAGYNKTILTVKEFRQALCYALDRKSFALATAPTNNAAFSLYSDLIIADPETGESYRSGDAAKQVLVDFWGLSDEIGSGKMYETVDDAIESITGYNLSLAKEKFDEAYDIAVADGLINETDKIQIKIGLPNSTANFYSKGYEFLVNCYTEAVVGTKLEGKLEFTMDDTLGNGFGNALRANQVDLLFGVGWSGSALDPYNLMEAYVTEAYRYNKCWDTSSEQLTVELDGVKYTASVLDWNKAIMGEEITVTAADGTTSTFKAGTADDNQEERYLVLCALEGAVLETYEMIPMIDNSSAALKSMQVEYYTEEYVYGVGRHGDFKYLTYDYTDAEWTDFVASQGGQLNYN